MKDTRREYTKKEDVPPPCPYCGEVGGCPVYYDFGRDPETGYHDAGERCSRCAPVVEQ